MYEVVLDEEMEEIFEIMQNNIGELLTNGIRNYYYIERAGYSYEVICGIGFNEEQFIENLPIYDIEEQIKKEVIYSGKKIKNKNETYADKEAFNEKGIQ